jgi:hypothetical protein
MFHSTDSHEVKARGFSSRPAAGRGNQSNAVSPPRKFGAQIRKWIHVSVEIRANKSDVHDSKVKSSRRLSKMQACCYGFWKVSNRFLSFLNVTPFGKRTTDNLIAEPGTGKPIGSPVDEHGVDPLEKSVSPVLLSGVM